MTYDSNYNTTIYLKVKVGPKWFVLDWFKVSKHDVFGHVIIGNEAFKHFHVVIVSVDAPCKFVKYNTRYGKFMSF